MSTAAALHDPLPEADLIGGLTFIKPQAEKPVFHSSALTGGAPNIFFETERLEVPLYDMRPIAENAHIDHEGFELMRHRTAVADLYDDAAVKDVYYLELQELLRRRFGATWVVVFDATRRSDNPEGARNPDGLRGPASRVHVDYTPKSGPQRLKDILGEAEAKRLADVGARVIQVNVWRPIKGPVRRSPLALADASTVAPHELVATDQVFPDRVGEIYSVAYGANQRWYYAPEMTPDEVLLIKGWDSQDDGRARFTPHGAVDVAVSPETPARESIEVRTMVIIEP